MSTPYISVAESFANLKAHNEMIEKLKEDIKRLDELRSKIKITEENGLFTVSGLTEGDLDIVKEALELL